MQTLEEAHKYQEWHKLLLENGLKINSIKPLHLVHKGKGELLFALIHIDAQDADGQKVLPIAMLRGHFVTVVTCLISKETGKKHLLLVKQRRIANGAVSFEHPAGMCDSETNPRKVALKEVQEETGLEIADSQLFMLSDKLLYSSPGLLDEGGYFFGCDVVLPQNEIDAFHNKNTGALGENEFIQTYICPLEEAIPLFNNTNGLLAQMLYLQNMQK